MNQSIAVGGVRRPEIILRQLYWAVIELVLGAGLAATHFLATSSGSFWWDVTGGAAIGCLVVAGLALRCLELRDDRGSVVRLSFFGTPRAQRRRFLAALEPYVMADSVYRAGQIGQALSGELWWPRPRLRS